MEITDQGILLSSRHFQENKRILCFFTKQHGKWSGVSHRKKIISQPGLFHLTWNARLEENLGSWKIIDPLHKGGEPTNWMIYPGKPYAVSSLLALLNQLLGDRDPHPFLFDSFVSFMNALGTTAPSWILSYISLELLLLKELGFALDLKKCALSQATHDLRWVSPLTGRAATHEAAASYTKNLLPLPPFLGNPTIPGPVSSRDIHQALLLTGYFLQKIYKEVIPGNAPLLPPLRDTFLSWVKNLSAFTVETLPPLLDETINRPPLTKVSLNQASSM